MCPSFTLKMFTAQRAPERLNGGREGYRSPSPPLAVSARGPRRRSLSPPSAPAPVVVDPPPFTPRRRSPLYSATHHQLAR